MSAPFFSRERIVAPPGWSRWLVPPAALSITSRSARPTRGACSRSRSKERSDLRHPQRPAVQLGIVVLGLSAAIFGTWVDRNGPRGAMFAAMCCFCGGWLVGSAGLAMHQYWLVLLGYGLRGWYRLGHRVHLAGLHPDQVVPRQAGHGDGIGDHGLRRRRAHRVAVVDGDARVFGTESMGIAKTFLVHGLGYAVFMSVGWLLVRVPREDWKPQGWTPQAPRRTRSSPAARSRRPTRSRRRSSGCCGLCCAST